MIDKGSDPVKKACYKLHQKIIQIYNFYRWRAHWSSWLGYSPFTRKIRAHLSSGKDTRLASHARDPGSSAFDRQTDKQCNRPKSDSGPGDRQEDRRCSTNHHSVCEWVGITFSQLNTFPMKKDHDWLWTTTARRW
eukprot:g52370.t1